MHTESNRNVPYLMALPSVNMWDEEGIISVAPVANASKHRDGSVNAGFSFTTQKNVFFFLLKEE
jgi:hypothetical protein